MSHNGSAAGGYPPAGESSDLKASSAKKALEDILVGGDWDGNGSVTVGLYRPSNATFFLHNRNAPGHPDIVVPFGTPGDIPVVGNWKSVPTP